jgi:hypothetical protein
MTEQTAADAYIESCLIDLSKQLTVAEHRIEGLERALRTLINSCDVEAWAVKEARAALEGKDASA